MKPSIESVQSRLGLPVSTHKHDWRLRSHLRKGRGYKTLSVRYRCAGCGQERSVKVSARFAAVEEAR